jgi:hypothetical protein
MKGLGGKHGKYVYVRRRDGLYVKVRVLKSREEKDPSRYIVVGPAVKNPPFTYKVLDESDLPSEVRDQLYSL